MPLFISLAPMEVFLAPEVEQSKSGAREEATVPSVTVCVWPLIVQYNHVETLLHSLSHSGSLVAMGTTDGNISVYSSRDLKVN